MKKLGIVLLFAVSLIGCSKEYVPEIKEVANKTFQQAGFKVIGYEGYAYGSFDTYGGKVWYTLTRIPDNGVTYHACISKWGDEFHIYNLESIDAIKPNKEN